RGFTVGIIGLTTTRTAAIAKHGKAITFTNEIESVNSAVKILRNQKNVDIVILLCHAGDIKQDSRHVTSIDIANNTSGIDLIIDGHSHSFFSKPKIVNNTPIVTAGSYSKYVGKGVMKITDRKVSDFSWEPVEINSTTFPPDPKITALLEPYKAKAEKSLNDIVFTTSRELEFGNSLVRYQEMPSGNILADAMIFELSKLGIVADFAIINSGNIRTGLPKGNVRRRDVLTMLPFTNSIFMVRLKGSDVLKLFDFIASIKQGSGAWAQVSDGVKYTITYDKNGNGEISSLTINYKKIDPEKEYSIAVNEFMANGNDGYDVLRNAIYSYNTSVLLSDAFINFMSTQDLAAISNDKKRITIIGGINPDQSDTFCNTILKTEATFDKHSAAPTNR
ncbi:MAG: 5'-nucleotidase C-terminal domain-containing protein, partial [Fibrobacter sp.]|nr:5'-nucleotidase C-terminal domain-containing protein [Fibrobacter sp.]